MIKKACAMGALCIVLSAWTTTPGWSADAAKGKALHDASCLTGCHAAKDDGHANDIYTRKGHLGSLEKLRGQVAACNQKVLGTQWWPDDEADVVEYLNREFYKFE